MQTLPKQKILVELDCLLDTRIGTVAMISDDLATAVLDNDYHERDEDKFEGVDPEQFKTLYANRNVDTLKHSTITCFMPLLRHLCTLIHEEALSRPYHSGPEVVINIYPYFMMNDVADAISIAVKKWVGIMTPVKVVRIEPKELTPRACKDYSLLVMYNPTEWFNIQLEELLKSHLRDVALYIPQMYHNKTETDEEIKKIEEEAVHPFVALELFMKPLIDVTLIDVTYFSLFRPEILLDLKNFKLNQASQIAS